MNSRRICKIISVMFLLIVTFNIFSIYATDTPPKPIDISGANTNNVAITAAKNVWATAKVIIQILAVAAIVITGLRYMFASADAKADIKSQTAILVIGAILVFGAVEFADFVYDAVTDLI